MNLRRGVVWVVYAERRAERELEADWEEGLVNVKEEEDLGAIVALSLTKW